ncbi:MAG: helix-turn-helix domain-containing protein [Candidatus Latescibacterota bacterium]
MRRAVEAPDARLRERFVALALVAMGHSGVAVATQVGKTRQTVSEWVLRFNRRGPEDMDLESRSAARWASGALPVRGAARRRVALAAGQWPPERRVNREAPGPGGLDRGQSPVRVASGT